MSEEPLPRVLLIADPAERNALASVLRESGAIVTDRATDLPDVIVVTLDAPSALSHARGEDNAVRPAVIAIGEISVDADVRLPADYSPRELILACELLGRIVHLRRLLQEGAQQGRAWQQAAACDSLTQLPNRRAWSEELSRRVDAARAAGHPLCVALVDLDHFKQVNDGWGHAAGDQLLKSTAAALRHSLRQDDFVARLGGDEFGLLLTGLDAASAATVIERVRIGLPARIAQSTPHVTSVSVGYTVFVGQTDATPELLETHADRARQLAKTQGRDRTVGG